MSSIRRDAGDDAPASARKRRWPTEPALWIPMLATLVLVGGPLTALCYTAPPWSYATRILWGNMIDVIILWLFAGAMLYLLLKRASLTREIATTEHFAREVLPSALDRQEPGGTTADIVKAFEREALRVRPGAEHNLLIARCRFLAHFSRAGGETDGTTVEHAVGPLDRDRMHASYAFTRFLVWAIPILGFIGTVLGISDAIGSFSEAMTRVESAADLTVELQRSMPAVTSGLAVAFDTTFIALVVSLPLVLFMTRLEKTEDNYLSELDELWLGTVAPRLAGRRKAEAAEPASAESTVGDELRLLSQQVKALQDVLTDLHQDVVVPNLRNVQ
jgi:hypothetical protein